MSGEMLDALAAARLIIGWLTVGAMALYLAAFLVLYRLALMGHWVGRIAARQRTPQKP